MPFDSRPFPLPQPPPPQPHFTLEQLISLVIGAQQITSPTAKLTKGIETVQDCIGQMLDGFRPNLQGPAQ